MLDNTDLSNFNLCPSNACYHSTCGTDTGTSVKIQCPADAGKLIVDEACIQEGVWTSDLPGHFASSNVSAKFSR